MTPFTILGAAGFVGGAVVARLRSQGWAVEAVARGELPALLASGRPAGHVIDCIGLTADFRKRPYDTAEAHVGVTARLLEKLKFNSLLFLSSTRVYAGATSTREDAALTVRPGDPSDLYNVTKLAGEALCLSDSRPSVRIARLSNVYGAQMGRANFVGQLLAEGVLRGKIAIGQAATSAKDYISVDDVAETLIGIAESGRARAYNVASGINTTHAEIAAALTQSFGWDVEFAPHAPAVVFPPIDVSRLTAEFGPKARRITDYLSRHVRDLKQEFS